MMAGVSRRRLLRTAALAAPALLAARVPAARAATAQHAFVWATGAFVTIGKQPDGDSVRFVPDDPAALGGIRRAHLLRPSRDGSLQLRLEGIDAPETHYKGHAQAMGDEARDYLLRTLLGFRALSFGRGGETVRTADPPALNGAILTRAADPHGRPICQVFTAADAAGAGDPGAADVTRSANFRMVARGYAYPLFYRSMPEAHHALFAQAARQARRSRAGVWARDTSGRFTLSGFGSIDRGAGGPADTAQLIYPKLYRRAIDYLRAADEGFEGDLGDWLAATPAENDHVRVDDGGPVRLSDLLRVDGDRCTFAADVTSTVFVER